MGGQIHDRGVVCLAVDNHHIFSVTGNLHALRVQPHLYLFYNLSICINDRHFINPIGDIKESFVEDGMMATDLRRIKLYLPYLLARRTVYYNHLAVHKIGDIEMIPRHGGKGLSRHEERRRNNAETKGKSSEVL